MVSDRHYHPPDRVLAAWGLAGADCAPLGNGLINRTFLVTGRQGRFVLQRLHRMFDPVVNEDIERVTRHLLARGRLTPTLVRTVTGQLWTGYEGGVWRLLTHIEGIAPPCMAGTAMAREAGALLGGFHRALADLDTVMRYRRPGVHDTPRHLAALETALATGRGHPQFARIEPLALEILAAADALPALPGELPERLVHGDPKVDNLLFSADGSRAICLLDLDTLGPMPLPLELGDALRSWCNPRGEDREAGGFSLELFEAALQGYAGATTGWLTEAEWRAFTDGTEIVHVELAARFCADALNESYFGWNPQRFASRSEHNRVRAAGQLAGARALRAARARADAVLEAAFAGAPAARCKNLAP